MKLKRSWRTILIELLVVFTGVYGAFLLNNYRESRKADENKRIYFEAFLGDLKYLNYQVDELRLLIKKLKENYTSAPEAEIIPNEDLRFEANNFLVGAAFQSENFSVIGAQYLNNLSYGSNMINEIKSRINTVQQESRDYYFNSSLTEEGKKRFKKWYLNELDNIEELLEELHQIINEGARPGVINILERLD